jgi:hypothetical protein
MRNTIVTAPSTSSNERRTGGSSVVSNNGLIPTPAFLFVAGNSVANAAATVPIS